MLNGFSMNDLDIALSTHTALIVQYFLVNKCALSDLTALKFIVFELFRNSMEIVYSK